MSVTIRLEGAKELQTALRNLSDEVREQVGRAVEGTAIMLRQDIVDRIQDGPASGVGYYRIFDAESGYMRIYAGNPDAYGPSKVVAVYKSDGKVNLDPFHQASAPGEAPATDTGRLMGSIYFDREGPLTATVGSKLAYAEWLEYGTSRMAPRPYFRPAVEAVRPKFERALERALAGVIK